VLPIVLRLKICRAKRLRRPPPTKRVSLNSY
jgi:hypothetical protein